MTTKLSVLKLPNTNTLIFKQSGGKDFFMASDGTLVIDIPSLSFIIKFLVMNHYLSPKVLEGILSEVKE